MSSSSGFSSGKGSTTKSKVSKNSIAYPNGSKLLILKRRLRTGSEAFRSLHKQSYTRLSSSLHPRAMTEPDEPHVSQHIESIDLSKHLEQIDLSQYIEQIDSILGDLAEFLRTAVFDPPKDGVEKCRDNGLPKACEAFIKALEWGDRVSISDMYFVDKR